MKGLYKNQIDYGVLGIPLLSFMWFQLSFGVPHFHLNAAKGKNSFFLDTTGDSSWPPFAVTGCFE